MKRLSDETLRAVARVALEDGLSTSPSVVLAMATELLEARAAIERVREIHQAIPVCESCESDDCERSDCVESDIREEYIHADVVIGYDCEHCSDLGIDEIEYPCATIRALNGVKSE